MCLRRGFGPRHRDWRYLSRTIVAFGGSVKRFRTGARPYGLQWRENSDVTPGTIGETRATPAATAMALLLSRQAAESAASPAPTDPAANDIGRSAAEPSLPPVLRWQVLARTATAPPTGPPAVRAHQFSYARTDGARA